MMSKTPGGGPRVSEDDHVALIRLPNSPLPPPRQSRRPADIVRLPPRRHRAILLTGEHDGAGWLVTRQEHGWAFGSRREALRFANDLARQHDEALVVEGWL